MKDRVLKTLNLILFFVAVFVVVGQAFAWFMVDQMSVDLSFGGSSTSAYFAGGSGKEGDPYLITTAQHMYNLAWLQDKGLLKETATDGTTNTTFYFKVNSDVDMDGMILPPIGTAANPFNSVFNGDGHTISNLSVSTDIDVLTNAADKNITFSNYVGMFGATGTNSNIRNFILLDPKVEVASVTSVGGKTVKYASGESSITAASGSYYAVGIAIGDVEGKASTIGVKTSSVRSTGQIAVRKSGYTTYNSILGNVNGKDVFVTGNTSTSGDGNHFGSNFNVAGLLSRMANIFKSQYGQDYYGDSSNSIVDGFLEYYHAYKDTSDYNLNSFLNTSNYSPFLPAMDTSTGNSNPVVASGAKIPFSAESELSTVTVTQNGKQVTYPAENILDTNTGYFFGNQNKITTKTLKFGDKLVDRYGTYMAETVTSSSTSYASPTNQNVPNWFYKYKGNTNYGSYSDTYLEPISEEDYNTLPSGIIDMLPGIGNKKTFTAIKLGTARYTSPDDVGKYATWPFYLQADGQNYYYSGQISWMGKTYGNGFRMQNGNALVYKTDSNGILTNEVEETYTNYTYYTGGVVMPSNGIWFKPSFDNSSGQKIRFVMMAESNDDSVVLLQVERTGATKENPFYLEGYELPFKVLISTKLPAYVLVYFEIELPADYYSAGNIEYVILNQTGSGAYFLYLDIGANGTNNAQTPDEGGYSTTADISAVDFIYDEVAISDNNFVVGSTFYKVTGSRVYFIFNQSAAIYLDFRRSSANYFTVTVNKGYTGNVVRVSSDTADGAIYSLNASDDIIFYFDA